jgi:hypothetical protein
MSDALPLVEKTKLLVAIDEEDEGRHLAKEPGCFLFHHHHR